MRGDDDCHMIATITIIIMGFTQLTISAVEAIEVYYEGFIAYFLNIYNIM